LTQSSDVTHAVRVVKNVTCLSSLFLPWGQGGSSLEQANVNFIIFFYFTTLRLILLQDEKIEQQYSSRKGGKTNPNELYFVSKIVQTSTVRML
jgi:hypothetical protein